MSGTYDVKKTLLAAYRSLMTPLVRILLRNGIAFREFVEVVKEVYVTVAARDLPADGRKMSLPRIAIATGLTRREVAEIVHGESSWRRAVESNANRAARVLEGWHTDPRFLAPYGFPRDLAVDGDDEVGTFATLVRRYSGDDMPHRAMLDELLRVGAAKVLEGGGFVRVLKRHYIPTEMTPELIQIFSQAVRRYIETVDYNLSQRTSGMRRFDRMVYPDPGLREVDVPVFQADIGEYLEGVIAEIDSRAATYPRPESSRGESPVQVGVGIYFYRVQADDDRALVELLAREEGDEGS